MSKNEFKIRKNFDVQDSTKASSLSEVFVNCLEYVLDYLKTYEREKTKREIIRKANEFKNLKIEL